MTQEEAVKVTTASFWRLVRETEPEANPDPIIYYDLDRDGIMIEQECQECGFAPGDTPDVIQLAASYKLLEDRRYPHLTHHIPAQ